MFFDSFATLSLFDKVASIALYVTIGVILAVAVALFVIKKKNPAQIRKATIITGSSLIAYTVLLLATLLGLKLDEYINNKFKDIKMEQETTKMFISDIKETIDLQEKFVTEV